MRAPAITLARVDGEPWVLLCGVAVRKLDLSLPADLRTYQRLLHGWEYEFRAYPDDWNPATPEYDLTF